MAKNCNSITLKINYNYFITWVFLILPILLEQPFIDKISTTIFIFFILLFLLFIELIPSRYNKIFYIDRLFLYFILLLILISFIHTSGNSLGYLEYLNIKKIFTGTIFFIICFLLIVLFSNNMHEDYLFNNYKIVSIILVILLLFQYILYYIFKIIPGYQIGDIVILKVSGFAITRFSSLFSEPAHMAIYLFPSFLYELFNRNKILIPIFMTIGIILTTSTLGLLLSIISWAYFFLREIDISELKINKTSFKKIGFLVVIILLLFLLNLEHINLLTERSLQGASSSARFFRGFEIFLALPGVYKIAGIGFSNISEYCSYYNIITKSIIRHDIFSGYVNTMSYFLITGGLIAFLFFLLLLSHLWKILSNNRIFIYIFFIMCLFAYMHNPGTWIFYFVIFYILAKKDTMIKVIF